MRDFFDAASIAAILIVILGFLGYAIALAWATFNGKEGVGQSLRSWFLDGAACNIGIPCSAIAAFAIVTTLLEAFPPPSQQTESELIIKAFDLEFSGPSGPVLLWLACFLVFVTSIRLLRAR